MTTKSDMRVEIRELPQTRDITVPGPFIAKALAEMPMRAALERADDDPNAGHAQAHVELYSNEDAHVFARGRLTGWFEVACRRCIEGMRVPLDEELVVTYLPKNQMLPDPDLAEAGEEGIELSAEDLDVSTYEGEVVDLEPLLREQLILAVPFAPLCKESCKGLCPQCGADLNREQCACEPILDPRLAALKDIKL